MDACVVWRENGDVELVLPNRPGTEEVPLNCLVASIAAIAFKDEGNTELVMAALNGLELK